MERQLDKPELVAAAFPGSAQAFHSSLAPRAILIAAALVVIYTHTWRAL